jgi:hypothetical protein
MTRSGTIFEYKGTFKAALRRATEALEGKFG